MTSVGQQLLEQRLMDLESRVFNFSAQHDKSHSSVLDRLGQIEQKLKSVTSNKVDKVDRCVAELEKYTNYDEIVEGLSEPVNAKVEHVLAFADDIQNDGLILEKIAQLESTMSSLDSTKIDEVRRAFDAKKNFSLAELEESLDLELQLRQQSQQINSWFMKTFDNFKHLNSEVEKLEQLAEQAD